MTRLTDLGLSRPQPTRRQTLGLLGAGAAIVGAGLTPGTALAQGAEDTALTEALVLHDPDVPVAGNPDGDVTIVEYFDYQCPYCKKLEPELRQVVQDDGKVKLIWKDWPILGDDSGIASRLVLATKYQDKYAKAHEALMSNNSKLTEPRIRELLAGAGIDVDRAVKDRDANIKSINDILTRNNAQATEFGFRGTPSFIVGKFRVPGILTMAEFGQVIADARKAASQK